jgi:hypothetical protein
MTENSQKGIQTVRYRPCAGGRFFAVEGEEMKSASLEAVFPVYADRFRQSA